MGLAAEGPRGDRFYIGTRQRHILAEYGAWYHDLGCLISYALGFEAGTKRYLEAATKQGQPGPSGQTYISRIRGYSTVAHAGLSGCAVLSTLLRGCPGQVHRV